MVPPMLHRSTYAERLDDAMIKAHCSTRELATKLKISYQAIKKAREGDTKALSAPNNAAAAAHLGVSSDWLATGQGNRRPLSPRARAIAEDLDRLGPPLSALYLEALADVRDALRKHEATPAFEPPAAPHAEPSPAPHPRTKTRAG